MSLGAIFSASWKCFFASAYFLPARDAVPNLMADASCAFWSAAVLAASWAWRAWARSCCARASLGMIAVASVNDLIATSYFFVVMAAWPDLIAASKAAFILAC